MKEGDRRKHIEDKRKKEINKTLALGMEGLGINETAPDNTAQIRVKDDITREHA